MGEIREGTVVDGAYRVEARLGQGGMGAVYRARRLADGHRVALKVLLPTIGTPADLARFAREARLAARVAGAGVVRVHAFGHHLDLPYCVMELVRGSDLETALSRSALDLPGLVAVLEQVARTVGRCHAAGVVHRDLKPANVLLGEAGEPPRVADFGAATGAGVERLTRSGEVIGTPAYMAPEQLGDGPVDGRADVYALGAILYRGLTGRPPFGGPAIQALYAVAHEDPVRPRLLAPHVPPALEAVCLRAMAKRPEGRYPTAEALADDLARVARGQRPEAEGPRGRRLRAAGAAGLALTGLVVLVAVGGPAAPAPAERRADAGRWVAERVDPWRLGLVSAPAPPLDELRVRLARLRPDSAGSDGATGRRAAAAARWLAHLGGERVPVEALAPGRSAADLAVDALLLLEAGDRDGAAARAARAVNRGSVPEALFLDAVLNATSLPRLAAAADLLERERPLSARAEELLQDGAVRVLRRILGAPPAEPARAWGGLAELGARRTPGWTEAAAGRALEDLARAWRGEVLGASGAPDLAALDEWLRVLEAGPYPLPAAPEAERLAQELLPRLVETAQTVPSGSPATRRAWRLLARLSPARVPLDDRVHRALFGAARLRSEAGSEPDSALALACLRYGVDLYTGSCLRPLGRLVDLDRAGAPPVLPPVSQAARLARAARQLLEHAGEGHAPPPGRPTCLELLELAFAADALPDAAPVYRADALLERASLLVAGVGGRPADPGEVEELLRRARAELGDHDDELLVDIEALRSTGVADWLPGWRALLGRLRVRHREAAGAPAWDTPRQAASKGLARALRILLQRRPHPADEAERRELLALIDEALQGAAGTGDTHDMLVAAGVRLCREAGELEAAKRFMTHAATRRRYVPLTAERIRLALALGELEEAGAHLEDLRGLGVPAELLAELEAEVAARR